MTSPASRFTGLAALVVAMIFAGSASAGGLVNPFIALPWTASGIQSNGQLGFSVAPVGDMNGDGFSDVIVGAFSEDNTEFDEGRAHLFLGAAGGLSLTPARIFVTAQDSAYGGWSVAPAGDVNGDGFADLLVGVPMWDTATHIDAGKVMVFHGGVNLPFLPTYSLFSPTPATNQRFGLPVSAAGDVNGDGYDDVVVGARNFTVGGFPLAGAAFVYHGGPTGLSATPARTWTGPAQDGNFGIALSTAGDVNGDGFADVLVGAQTANAGFVNSGAAHLFLGSAAGAEAVADTVIVGTAANEFCGTSVANAGDVNGDGYADVLIGSPGYNGSVGRARLFRGGPNGLANGTTLLNTENLPNEQIGLRVATFGDLNGDGFADFGIVARYTSAGGRGRITVFRGSTNGPSIMGDLLAPPGGGFFGTSIATAGDTNGDGLSEMLIGTEDWSVVPNYYEGKAFLYAAPQILPTLNPLWPQLGPQPGTGYGTALALLAKKSGALFPTLAIGDPGFDGFGRITFHDGGTFAGINAGAAPGSLVGTVNFQNRGARLADVGDVDRNAYSDMVSSSTTLDNGSIAQAGRVDFHPGANAGLQAPVPFLVGEHDFDRVGTALAGRGDVNGDGYHDVLVGAREWNSAALDNCGKAWLFFGSPTGPSPAPWTREGSAAGAGLGASVALTDLDGDGYSDIVIGSSSPPSGVQVPAGKVEIFYGGPGGPGSDPGLVLAGLVSDLSYGATVAAIGDVTDDQIADLAIGAPLQDGVGIVYIHAGTLGRSQTRAPIRIYRGIQAGARFGAAIAGGGDIDGDGIGDLAIGAPRFTSTAAEEGRFDFYLGAPDLPSPTRAFAFTNGEVGSRVGESIAPFADSNLDGFADIVVGAPGGFGRVYPFLGGSGPGHFATIALYEPIISNLRRFHPARIDDDDQVTAELLYASPGGRARIGVEFEVVPQNLRFTGVPTQATGIIYDSDAPDEGAGLLSSVIRVFPKIDFPWPGRGYRVRARFVTRSPFFPRSRWITPEVHTSGDLDVWMSGDVVDAVPPTEGVRPGLHGVAPNPSAAGGLARVSFALAQAGRVQLDLYNVRGALVRRLLDEPRPGGPSTVAWDGRDDHGRSVPPGLYFAHFVGNGRAARARIVRLP